jgi:hypothetical protein
MRVRFGWCREEHEAAEVYLRSGAGPPALSSGHDAANPVSVDLYVPDGSVRQRS